MTPPDPLREAAIDLLRALESMQHSPDRNDDVAWAILLGGNGAAGELRAALAATPPAVPTYTEVERLDRPGNRANLDSPAHGVGVGGNPEAGYMVKEGGVPAAAGINVERLVGDMPDGWHFYSLERDDNGNWNASISKRLSAEHWDFVQADGSTAEEALTFLKEKIAAEYARLSAASATSSDLDFETFAATQGADEGATEDETP